MITNVLSWKWHTWLYDDQRMITDNWKQMNSWFRPACLAPTTTPRSKSLKSPFFILMLSLNFSRSSQPFLHALSCHVIGWLGICVRSSWPGVPNKVASEGGFQVNLYHNKWNDHLKIGFCLYSRCLHLVTLVSTFDLNLWPPQSNQFVKVDIPSRCSWGGAFTKTGWMDKHNASIHSFLQHRGIKIEETGNGAKAFSQHCSLIKTA